MSWCGAGMSHTLDHGASIGGEEEQTQGRRQYSTWLLLLLLLSSSIPISIPRRERRDGN